MVFASHCHSEDQGLPDGAAHSRMVMRRPVLSIELGPTTTVTICPLVKAPVGALGTSVTAEGYAFVQCAHGGWIMWWQTELIGADGWPGGITPVAPAADVPSMATVMTIPMMAPASSRDRRLITTGRGRGSACPPQHGCPRSIFCYLYRKCLTIMTSIFGSGNGQGELPLLQVAGSLHYVTSTGPL